MLGFLITYTQRLFIFQGNLRFNIFEYIWNHGFFGQSGCRMGAALGQENQILHLSVFAKESRHGQGGSGGSLRRDLLI